MKPLPLPVCPYCGHAITSLKDVSHPPAVGGIWRHRWCGDLVK